MAVWDYDEFGDGERADLRETLARAMNWTGAGLSLALIAGLVWWGVTLWQRDVSGVPVVRALEGPMRTAPENPGGVASEYQGLAVNRIAEERVDDAAPAQVTLAPAAPALAPEDAPMAALAPETDEGTAPASETVEVGAAPSFGLAAEDDTAAAAPQAPPAENAPSATDLAVAEALGGLFADPEVMNIAGTVPVAIPRAAARPERRLASLGTMSDAMPEPAVPAVATLPGELAAGAIAPGTRLVQLGAFDTPDEARAEWQALAGTFADYMVGKSRVVQEKRSGGRIFYRLRAHGYDDLQDARRFCAVLVAEGANCIPVVAD